MTQRRSAHLLAAAALTGIILTGCGSADDTTEAATSSTSSTSASSGAATSQDADGSDEAGTSAYTAGTYEADGSYTSPGGEETIEVSLTIDDAGVISEVTVENPNTTNPNSQRYQGEFIDGIGDEVVGQSIDELQVDRVGGSSLTSGGFNAAVEEIKSEAAA